MFYNPESGYKLPHDPFKAIVTPRPIGWISSIDKDKNVNNVVYEARQCFGFATDLFKEMLQFIKNNEKRFGDGTTK